MRGCYNGWKGIWPPVLHLDRATSKISVFDRSLLSFQRAFTTRLGLTAVLVANDNNMDDEKSRTEMGHYEDRQVEMDSYSSEYEPPSEYKVHWRTFAAIFALAMGNVCAAMSNTVSKIRFPRL